MFDGSFKNKNSISLRGNSKKEDKATLMRKAREERKERLRQRAIQDNSLLIQAYYRRFRAVRNAKNEELEYCTSLILHKLNQPQDLSFSEIFNICNRLRFILSCHTMNLKLWQLIAKFLQDTRTNSYQNAPKELIEPFIHQQQQIFRAGMQMLNSCNPADFTPISIDLVKALDLIYKSSTLSNSYDNIASDKALTKALSRWNGKNIHVCNFLFKVISQCLEGATNKQILSERFVRDFIMDIRKQIAVMSDEMLENLLVVIPKLSGLSNFITEEFSENNIAVIQVLFGLCFRRPNILPFILEGFNVDNMNALIQREKQSMDSSDEEWYSDEEEDFEELSISRQFLVALSKFASPEFLKKYVAVAFSNDSPSHEIDINLITLCRLGVLLNELSTRDNTFFHMVNHLAFYFRIVPKMWRVLINSKFIAKFDIQNIQNSQSFILTFFCLVCKRWLLAVDDHEFFDSQEFLRLSEWKEMTMFLKQVVITQYESCYSQQHKDNFQKSFAEASAGLLHLLYERECRKSFVDEGWVSAEITHIFHHDTSAHDFIIENVPFFIPLDDRFKVFDDQRDRTLSSSFHSRKTVKIRRENLFEEGYDKLVGLTAQQLSQKFRVEFINAQGLAEAGIDGGGLFKEFITEMLHQGFNPDSGLFTNSHSNELYPNPDAPKTVEDWRKMFHFLGRLLGKSLFDLVLVHLPLSRFFIARILQKSVNHVNDLSILNPGLYKGLMDLKNYTGNVEEDFGLTFSLSEDVLGEKQIVDLVPGGRNKPVTNQNRMKYIFLMARYRMNVQIKPQVDCFLTGFYEIIPQQWIRMFNEDELQQLISGVQGTLDLDDFRKNTTYSGGYSDDHPVIEMFWIVLESLSPEQQRKFLQFVTSSERSPLLGFSYLEPKFCIQRGDDITRLPTAGTCFNLLKLPPYQKFEVLRQKLVYSIESSSGFEMS